MFILFLLMNITCTNESYNHKESYHNFTFQVYKNYESKLFVDINKINLMENSKVNESKSNKRNLDIYCNNIEVNSDNEIIQQI